MPRFELDEAAVAQTEQLLFDTGEVVNGEAGKARDAVTGATGTLRGNAFNAATNKQVGDFAESAGLLHNEIAHIADALGLGRKAVLAQDDLDMQEFTNINYDRL